MTNCVSLWPFDVKCNSSSSLFTMGFDTDSWPRLRLWGRRHRYRSPFLRDGDLRYSNQRPCVTPDHGFRYRHPLKTLYSSTRKVAENLILRVTKRRVRFVPCFATFKESMSSESRIPSVLFFVCNWYIVESSSITVLTLTEDQILKKY